MEVHHHPDVGKKSLKEYLLEGLMIFIAVTMGFFAESIREHVNERGRERDYMRSLAEDLRVDTSRINRALYWDTLEYRYSDTLMDLIVKPATSQEDIRKAYHIVWMTEDEEDVHFSDRTYDALKSSGDTRLIHSAMVTDSIQAYENGIRNCMDQDAFYGARTSKMAEVAGPIFKASLRFRRVGNQPYRFGTTDTTTLDLYCNELGIYQGGLRSYILMIKDQKKAAVLLLALLQKEYDL